MSLRSKIWLVVAALFTLLNLAGAAYAAIQLEILHACVHGVLALLGAWLVGRIVGSRVESY